MSAPTRVDQPLGESARCAWAWLAAALGLAVLAAHGVKLWFYTEEDAYICARYARNLAAGLGLVYNVGEREWGSTTTLLPVLQALATLAGFNVIRATKLIGLASAAATALLLWRISSRHAPRPLAALAVGLTAAFPPLLLWSVGGLETALFVALVTGALAAAFREHDRPDRLVPWSALLLLLAALTRPDAPLYAPVVLLAQWDRARPRASLRWLLAFCGGVVVLWGAHAAYYGAWAPNPLLSKVAGISGRARLGARYFRDFAAAMTPLVACTTAAALGLAAFSRGARRREAGILGLGLLLAVVYPIWTGGDWMPLFRFYAPFIAFAVPLLVWASALLLGLAGSRHGKVALLVLCVAWSALAWTVYRAEAGWMVRLRVLRTANDLYLRLGRLAKGAQKDVTYALADIGGFGWESEARILDLNGLVDRRIAARPHGLEGPHPLPELSQERPEVVLPVIYAGSDEPFKEELYAAVRDLAGGPLPPNRVSRLLRHARHRPNEDAFAFLRASPDYRLVNIAIFPTMPQYYLVFVREDALTRVPSALLHDRLGAGLAEYEVGDRATGLRLLQEELASNPYDELGLAAQGRRWSAAGRWDEAVDALRRAIALAPDQASHYFTLGTIYGRAKRYEEAVEAYEKSVALNPESADAQNNLGFTLGLLGRYEAARRALQTALRLRPDYPLARHNLAWVESQRRAPPATP